MIRFDHLTKEYNGIPASAIPVRELGPILLIRTSGGVYYFFRKYRRR
ncbi:hypothetical protein [Methanolacinia paynteri]|nr:hypothetical protein [Methanolacinia paynteri]